MDVIRTVTAALQDQLGAHLDDLARRCGAVRRQRKFTGQALLRVLALTLLHKPDATTTDFLATATTLGLDVSAAALAKRWQAGQPLVDCPAAGPGAGLAAHGRLPAGRRRLVAALHRRLRRR